MYAKIFASLWDGSLRGQSDAILVFVNLLSHSDPNGVVDRHFKTIADETGLPADRVRAAAHALEAPDKDSRSPLEDGRRIVRLDEHRDWGWRIVNHDHYRMIVSEAERREKAKERTRKWRESKDLQHCDAPVTPRDAGDAIQKHIQKHTHIGVHTRTSSGVEGVLGGESHAERILARTGDDGRVVSEVVDWLRERLCMEYRRPPSDRWSYEEERLLVETAARPGVKGEANELFLYRARKNGSFFPSSVLGLLTGWTKTLDQSRNYRPPATGPQMSDRSMRPPVA